MTIDLRAETFRLAEAFTISRGSRTEAKVLTVSGSGPVPAGRCVPLPPGETLESVAAQVEGLPGEVSRAALQGLLPAGAARNAVDCALWDLEARHAGRRVWELAGLAAPGPVVTAYTLSLDATENTVGGGATCGPPASEDQAGHAEDMPRREAVRPGAAARIVVAASRVTAEVYADLAPHLVRLGVEMVEQPLPAGADDMLGEIARPLPVCADAPAMTPAACRLAGEYPTW
ncbi:MAG: dipeptide epimerase [Paracoccaceae bacterium]